MASVRRDQELHMSEPGLAGSKMNPLLPKAKPISDSGRASVMAYLRKGKKH